MTRLITHYQQRGTKNKDKTICYANTWGEATGVVGGIAGTIATRSQIGGIIWGGVIGGSNWIGVFFGGCSFERHGLFGMPR